MNIWIDSLIKFVPTRASQEILLSVEENPFILITGPFGSGKTAIAYYIISKFEKNGYEIFVASEPEEIVSRFRRNHRQLFLFDDILGKYLSPISDITDRWEKFSSKINEVLTKSNSVKIVITCRTHIFLLNEKVLKIFSTSSGFIHQDLISKELRLNLEERQNIYQSYFRSNPPKSISDDILSLYNFYPVMCSSYTKENLLKYFKHPVDIIYAEIANMQTLSDIGYLALAILVVLNNKIEISKLSGSSDSEKIDTILIDVFNESGFNQYPSKDMLLLTFKSLKGVFIMDDETYFSFLSPELFDVVSICIGGSFLKSILTHSSSLFIKEKLQLPVTQGSDSPHAIIVPQMMESEFYQRLASDMKNNLIFDALSNKSLETKKNRQTFVCYLETNVESKKLDDALTGSNVFHIVSSLGYTDFFTYFLENRYLGVNKKNFNGETPLHLACRNGHTSIVERLLKFKPTIDEKDVNKRTALHYACEAGHENIVKYLIANGASLNKSEVKGLTPLHLACEQGYDSIVKCLVEQNANTNKRDKKYRTPLHYASKHRMCNTAETLISYKALVNTSDDQGSSPLHISCECGNEDVVKLLVKHNAVTSSKNKKGLTPLDIAMSKGFDTISSFLR